MKKKLDIKIEPGIIGIAAFGMSNEQILSIAEAMIPGPTRKRNIELKKIRNALWMDRRVLYGSLFDQVE